MTFEKMDQIREQQEQLARLHFEMDIQQDMQRSAGVKVKYHNVAIFCYKIHLKIFYEIIMGAERDCDIYVRDKIKVYCNTKNKNYTLYK